MMASVTVGVPARLHLGFLDLNGGARRRFGGIGLAISDPETVDSCGARRKESVGPEAERALASLAKLCSRHLGLDGASW